MTVVLRLAFLEPSPEIPITDAQLNEARLARTTLNAAFALEETYDLLLANFLELEQETLCSAASSVVRNIASYEELFEVRSRSNRRVVNLLSSARLYIDHAPQHLADCTQHSSAAKELFRKTTSTQYDSQFSYRFMEALRNHVQHSGLAVHVVRHASRWTGTEPDTVLETRLELLTEKRFLLEDAQFQKKTLAETPDRVELIQAAREYLQGLGQVHSEIRAHIAQSALMARDVLQKLIDSYAPVNNGRTLGLSVMRVDGDEREPLLPIFLDWDDLRMKLLARNSTLGNLGRRVATGRLGSPARWQRCPTRRM